MEDTLEKRKQKIMNFLGEDRKSNLISYLILAGIILFGFVMRLRNLDLLRDSSTGKFIPLALDPFVVLRYVQQIAENGALSAVDFLRYYPFGFGNVIGEFGFLSYFVFILHKILSFFNPSITLEQTHVIYPAIGFIFITLFFFLFVRKLFNDNRIALIASAFLSVVPTFLYRTMAGFSDKESLALVLMFLSFYLYVSAWKTKKFRNGVFLGILSGISTGMTGLVWGGAKFIFLIIGLHAFIEIFLNKFKKKDFYIYSGWVIFTIFVLNVFGAGRFPLKTFLTSFTSSVMVISFAMGIVWYLLFNKNLFKARERFEGKYPKGMVSFVITIIAGIIFTIIFFGPSFIPEKIGGIYTDLTEPFGTSRWALTVAESHQPYVRDWTNNFGWAYMLTFLAGAVLLFYEMLKKLSKHRIKAPIIFALFLVSFTFSRYSPGSILNGVTTFSQTLYIGSLIAFIVIMGGYYLYSFYRDKERFKEILEIDKTYIFLFVFLVIMIVAGRSALRLLLVLTPITAILTAYLLVRAYQYASSNFKSNLGKAIVYVAILYLIFSPLYAFATTSLSQAQATGPSYNQQWQQAMDWVRKNTPEDAIFAHWWDYGYWVQYGGERATLSDGGNSRGAINHFIGRHLLTGQSDEEALQLLKANKVTHVLMIADEIGKYPAFSSIGSDFAYDRYSWINTFTLDPQLQEGRDGSLLFYRGGTALDDDFVYQGRLFPANSAGIAGFIISISGDSLNNLGNINGVPQAVIVYNNEQVRVPISCLFLGNQRFNFENEEALQGCLRIIPLFNSPSQMNPLGAALYLSPDVTKSRFAEYYLFNSQNENFRLVYDDSNNLPLASFQGRIIGPLKIWEVSYPDDLGVPEEFYGQELPDPRVDLVRR